MPLPLAPDLQVGFMTAITNAESARKNAELALDNGYDAIWTGDHVAFAVPVLDPLLQLAQLAAFAPGLTVGTSVYLLPLRHPVLVAKQIATLDHLTGGRLIFGAGAGWMKEEFEALNVPFANHGPRMAEYLEVIRRCWTEDDPSFDGRYYKLGDVGFYPKPVQKPHPPIWVGGFADGALRRVARYGDAWHAGGTPEMLSQGYAKVKQYANEYGRDPDSIALTLRGDGIGRGDPAQTIEELRPYKDAGVSMVMLTFIGPNADAVGEKMTAFMRDVAGSV